MRKSRCDKRFEVCGLPFVGTVLGDVLSICVCGVAGTPGRYDRGMKVDKLSISFEPELGDAVRAAARQHGTGLSRWLAEAAAVKLRTGGRWMSR